MSELRAARVRVPCSTSNLGSGFDTLGIALSRYLVAEYRPGPGPLRVLRSGSLGAGGVVEGGDFLEDAFRHGAFPDGSRATGEITASSDIPIGRGLGSSAASVVAGLALGYAARGAVPERHAIFERGFRTEGHGDNVAPSVFGGLQAVVRGMDGVRALSLPLFPGIGFAYAAPEAPLPTRAARDALPRTVDHETATAGLGRLAALMRGLADGDPELIRIGVEDELHVPHRLPLIPGAYNAVGAGYDAGAWGVTISGSGSGLLALCAPEDAPAVAEAMRQVFAVGLEESAAIAFALEPDRTGLVVEPERRGPAAE